MIIAYIGPANLRRDAMPQQFTSGGLEDIAAKLKNDFEAGRDEFSENMIKLKGHFEASKAKFDAELDAISPRRPNAPTMPNSSAPAMPSSSSKWILARKAWAWLHRD
jgi:hypothetical protein